MRHTLARFEELSILAPNERPAYPGANHIDPGIAGGAEVLILRSRPCCQRRSHIRPRLLLASSLRTERRCPAK